MCLTGERIFCIPLIAPFALVFPSRWLPITETVVLLNLWISQAPPLHSRLVTRLTHAHGLVGCVRVRIEIRERFLHAAIDAGFHPRHSELKGISSLNGPAPAVSFGATFSFTASDMNFPYLPSLIQADSQYSVPAIVRLPL